MATRIIEQWWQGDYRNDPEGRVAELERVLGEWYQSLAFGPIPGAYMSWKFTHMDSGGLTVAATVPVDSVVLPSVVTAPSQNEIYEARPIAIFADAFPFILPAGESVDLQFWYLDPNDFPVLTAIPILNTPLTVQQGAIGARAERDTDTFAVDKLFGPYVWMSVEATSMAPSAVTHVTAHMVVDQSATAER